jgi:LysR family transcriptional regulator, glycine cleavage system transcriptional activator
MARLPLATLPAFQAAARRANLRAAAEALHLTHSAISQQIRVLETQLGFALFERRGRRIVLNAAGKALLASVDTALSQLDDGVLAAAAAARGAAQQLRVTVLPSFAQRWLLPRIGRWHERHPDIALEVDATQSVVDLQREGFHAGLRTGRGSWPGLESERLIDSPLIVVGTPAAARRLLGQGPAALAKEPLIGDAPMWENWFAAAGVKIKVRPVAEFNDGGLMLQAAEHGLGITLAREMFAADPIAEGRLVRLSPVSVEIPDSRGYFLVYPPALHDWPPLAALRAWLHDELARAQREMEALRSAMTAAPPSSPTSRRRAQTAKPKSRRTARSAARRR